MGNVGSAVQKAFSSGPAAEPAHPLDAYARFSDLYDSCPWTNQAARKLIITGALAPIVKGAESKTKDDDEECPICFMYNSQVMCVCVWGGRVGEIPATPVPGVL